jgi:hypothetical protein
MTIRRRCKERNCKRGRKCLEHLRFDEMYRGKRYRVPANEFAIPRMEPGKQRPIQSMEEARDWERRFIGEIKAGRDPRRLPSRSIQAGTELGNVSAFLDAYMERCVKPAGLRSISAVRSRVSVLKEHLGDLSLAVLEGPDEINRFKTESDYAEDVEIATMHRALETLRAAMNWHGANAAAVQPDAVSPVRSSLEQEGGDESRPAALTRRREAPARCRAGQDERS